VRANFSSTPANITNIVLKSGTALGDDPRDRFFSGNGGGTGLPIRRTVRVIVLAILKAISSVHARLAPGSERALVAGVVPLVLLGNSTDDHGIAWGLRCLYTLGNLAGRGCSATSAV